MKLYYTGEKLCIDYCEEDQTNHYSKFCLKHKSCLTCLMKFEDSLGISNDTPTAIVKTGVVLILFREGQK